MCVCVRVRVHEFGRVLCLIHLPLCINPLLSPLHCSLPCIALSLDSLALVFSLGEVGADRLDDDRRLCVKKCVRVCVCVRARACNVNFRLSVNLLILSPLPICVCAVRLYLCLCLCLCPCPRLCQTLSALACSAPAHTLSTCMLGRSEGAAVVFRLERHLSP
jgi:hypothetical protein